MERYNKAKRRDTVSRVFTLICLCFVLLLLLTGNSKKIYSRFRGKRDNFIIPRIIHKSVSVQNRSDTSSSSYHGSLGSDWKYAWWTKEDARKLLTRNFAWLLDIYDGMPSDHLREELNKFLFLYAYGGVYVENELIGTHYLDSILENKCVMLAISENFQNNDSKGDNVFAGVSFHPFFLLCIRKIIEKYHHGIMTATKLLDLKTLKALCEEWQSVKNQIYIESIEEPGINPSNSSLVAWEIDKISTSKVVPCYEVSLVSKISLFP